MSAERPKGGDIAKVDTPRTEMNSELERVVEDTLAPNLQKLPPRDRQHVIQEVTMMVSMSGPLPPPAIARQFEEMCPGFVDRSLAIAERAQQAEIEAAADERKKNQTYRILGMLCAALVTLSLITAGVYIATYVNLVAGVITSLISFIGSAVAAFINGRPLADGSHNKEPPAQKPPTRAPSKRRRR